GGNSSYALYTSGGGLSFYVTTTNGFALSPDAGFVWDGNFHHVVGTYDGSYVRIYVDGAEVGSGSALAGTMAYDNTLDNGDLFLGAFNSGGQGFTGTLDEPSIYNSALGPAEVASRYSAR